MTKYHTIKFILDIAYEDHNKLPELEKNWEKWFKSIIKIFNNDIPIALRFGLLNKNNIQLSEILDNYILFLYKDVKFTLKEINEDKYYKWIERRDAGNKRTLHERKKIQDEKIANIKKKHQLEHELYCNQMQPI
jgi:hypothetical protein